MLLRIKCKPAQLSYANAMSKPRIIGGEAKGRSLETPKRGTRPSPSRLREALFNILEFRERGSFLDLFSGSGAIGLEAASRGWESTCVDLSKEAAAVIRHNATNLNLSVQVKQADALKFAAQHPQQYDIVFAAPPYPLDLNELFNSILRSQPATRDGLYILQHPTHYALNLPVVTDNTRVYGSNALSFVEASVLGVSD